LFFDVALLPENLGILYIHLQQSKPFCGGKKPFLAVFYFLVVNLKSIENR
jgi:hypothetical protein